MEVSPERIRGYLDGGPRIRTLAFGSILGPTISRKDHLGHLQRAPIDGFTSFRRVNTSSHTVAAS